MYQKEILLNGKLLGVLNSRNDDSFSSLDGELDLKGLKCFVSLGANKNWSQEDSYEVFKKFYDNFNSWNEELKTSIANELLELASSWFMELKNRDITREEFLYCIQLKEVFVKPNGKLVFCFDDDDIFMGNTIIVETDINKTFKIVDIWG